MDVPESDVWKEKDGKKKQHKMDDESKKDENYDSQGRKTIMDNKIGGLMQRAMSRGGSMEQRQ